MVTHTFVINLDHQKERLDAIQRNLDQYGVQFTRIPGVYGRDVQKRHRVCDTVCTNGMLGCYQAHVNVWKTILDNPEYQDDDVFLVLEDDARLTGESLRVIHEAVQQSKIYAFDVLSLWNPLEKFPQACMSEALYRDYRVCMHPLLVTTSGYLITKRGVRKTLGALGEKSLYHVDVCMLYAMWRGKINYFCIHPNVIQVDGFHDSSIATGAAPFYWVYLLKVPVLSLYQIFNINVGMLLVAHILLLFAASLFVPDFPWMIQSSLIGVAAILVYFTLL